MPSKKQEIRKQVKKKVEKGRNGASGTQSRG